MKEIYFLIDGLITVNLLDCLEGCKICTTFDSTDEAIKNGIAKIATYSMIHLSFDLITKGYDIYLVNAGNKIQIAPGMPEIDKELRFGHNIRKLFLAGVFDDLVKYER